MGLKDEIFEALVGNIQPDNPGENFTFSDVAVDKVDVLAQGLTDAIINFITNQEFNITEMEAPINFLPGTINVVGSPAAQANVAPITNIAQISQTSNKILDGRVPGAVRNSKVKLLQVKDK